jgi:hypothetical protein
MMLAWILSPLGRWLSLLGAVFAAIGIAWLKGRAAGKAAWQAKRQAAKAKALTTSSEIRHDVQTDSDAALDRRLDGNPPVFGGGLA